MASSRPAAAPDAPTHAATRAATASRAAAILRETFGYDGFRGHQAAAIETLLAGRDALVLMPTGGGKSVVYQVATLARGGVGVVVSPLIALMQDQVDALRELGVRAAFLNSTLSGSEAAAVERGVQAGDIDLLYVAPERLLQPRTLELLDRARLALFAIDEAHCVSQWGHDFRPEYLGLGVLSERFPEVPRLALTATADQQTRREIVEKLSLQSASVFVSSFDRPNIRYAIQDKTEPRRQLLALIARHQGEAGIVYCLSRRKVEDTAQWLAEQGVDALPYHAGLEQSMRARNQARFLREDGVVMIATIAFGMGIDKPDVRFVAHLDLPRSIEGYYQETGRAGRDGAPAEAWMAWSAQDVVQQRRMIEESEGGEEFKRLARSRLELLVGLAESTACRRRHLLSYFGEEARDACGNCDNCLEQPATWDATEAARMALSCVARCGQRFGAGHIIDVLIGNDTDKVLRNGHDRLSTYGIGTGLDVKRWRQVMRQLVVREHLSVDHLAYGALKLTARAGPLLRGEETFEVRVEPEKVRAAKARVRSGSTASDLPAEAAELFERLRAWRGVVARERSVPAYVIFHDSTLRTIAIEKPGSLDELARIGGVGANKLQAYGEALLAEVAGVG